MKQNIVLLICCLMISMISLGQDKQPDKLLREAIYQEEVNGNIEQALKQYQIIVNDYSDNRPVAAKAQLHIGLCYEKLGKQQATEAYNKVIEQFADQLQTAEIAKTRLQNLNSKIASVDKNAAPPTVRQIVLDRKLLGIVNHGPTSYDISPDGENFVFVSEREDSESGTALYVTSLAGPPSTRLVTSSDFIQESWAKYTNDGKNILIAGKRNPRDLWRRYLVKATGGKPESFSKNAIFGLCGDYKIQRKKRDENLIIIGNLTGDSISSFSFPPRIEYSWAYITDISPNSKWISYSAKFKSERRNELECWIVSFSGNKHKRITNRKGFDGYGMWLGNNNYYYFVSDRNGNDNIFRIKINPKTGENIGTAEQITFYEDADVLIPCFNKKKNAIVYCLSQKNYEIVISENENFDSFKTIATGTSPVLSPDGNTVYFVGTGKDSKGIYSSPRTGGVRKRLTDLVPIPGYAASHNPGYICLSPDGSIIAFFTRKNKNEVQLCFLSSDGKKLHKSIIYNILSTDPRTNIVPEWSPDGEKVAFGYNNAVYTIPVWGNKKEKLATVKGWEQYSTKWSPDGKYIAGFVWDDEKELIDVVIVSIKTREIKKLTPDSESNWKEYLEWHPSGKKLTYMYYDSDNDDDGLREAYVDGSPTTEMINQPDVWDYFGKWDPNGQYYYFVGSIQPGWQLYRYNSSTKEIKHLIENPGLKLPDWNKDGKYMVFSRMKTENQLWMMEGVE